MSAAILFVEDNAGLRENAALVLELEGYTVRVAADGREALDILEAGFVPELIVSDIMMPRLDGYAFFRVVRQMPHLRSVPFIFLTALGARHEISLGKIMGADDYLVKPFEPEEFLIAIRNKLQRVAELRASAAEELDQARRQLVQLLSHELRTPLTYVTGGFALLAEEMQRPQDLALSEDVRVSLELIQSGTQRLNRLAEQMVLYSQIISGYVRHRVETTSEVLDLTQVLRDAALDLRDLAQGHEIAIDQRAIGSGPICIAGVRELLVAAVSEVLRNAILYSLAGSTVHLEVMCDNGWATVIVRDHGVGIKVEEQEHVWQILVQSNRERHEQQGSGMGLPVVKGIVEAHGGSVSLQSAPGEGTTVILRLPCSVQTNFCA